MSVVLKAIPNLDVFLALDVAELAGKLLFAFRKVQEENSLQQFNPQALWVEMFEMLAKNQLYAREKLREAELAFIEAVAWLEAQALIIPSPGSNGRFGHRMLSRRARHFESETQFANYQIAQMLKREALHPRIAEKVWLSFMRNDFDTAVFEAMKAVEVYVREASGSSAKNLGVKLMQSAFGDDGPLTDSSMESGERLARMQLFVGAIGSYKNPQSHRDVNLDDPVEAVEIILLANHLLRIVEARAKAKG